MIDIHSHLIPFVDDGSPDLNTSLKLIKDEIDEGVTDIVLTPHFRLDWLCEPPTVIKKEFDKLKTAVKEKGYKVNLYLGQELHNFKEIPSMLSTGDAISLNGTEYVLLELSWSVKAESLPDRIKDYQTRGYKPILAHYERFNYRDIKEVEEFKKEGVLFQVNAYSLFGVESEVAKNFAFQMIERGLVDFIAGDYHMGKQLKMREGYELIKDKFSKATADKLFIENAKKLILKG